MMEKTNYRLIAHYNPKSPFSEAFRALRTNLEFSAFGQGLKSILVTSAGLMEGKSTVAANLAVVLAQMGKKVVLVDADLRKPALHSIFHLKNKSGLSNMLIKGPAEEFLSDTVVPNLQVVTSGPLPPNPAELLGTAMMDKIIDFLSSGAEAVLFDCPPLIAVTDAAVLSRKTDGVIMVARIGVSRREAVSTAVNMLKNLQSRILGFVVNDVSFTNNYGYGYYYDS